MLRLFKKQSVAAKIENLESKIEDSFKPTQLEIATNWFTILGTAVSLVIAIWALFLTYRYGESLDEINQLKQIASNQSQQTNRLIEIVNRLETQDSLMRDELNVMQNMGVKMSEQYMINLKTYQRQGNDSIENIRISKLRFEQVCRVVLDSLGSYRIKGGIDPNISNAKTNIILWADRTKALLNKVIKLMRGELTNNYVRSGEVSVDKWIEYISMLEEIMSKFAYNDFPTTLEEAEEIFTKIGGIHYLIMEGQGLFRFK